GHGHSAFRRQLELAWAGLAPHQLPVDRGPARVPPLLRRYLPDRVPDRIWPVGRPRRRGTRTRRAARFPVRATGGTTAALPRLLRTLRGRPALARLHPLLRVLRRGHRPRAGGESSDRLDRPGRLPARGLRPQAWGWRGLRTVTEGSTATTRRSGR